MLLALRTASPLIALLAVAAPAGAQGPAGAQFTGGSVGSSVRNPAGTSEIAVSVSGDGTRVRVRGEALVRCPSGIVSSEATGRADITLAPDGTFAADLTPTRQVQNPRYKARLRVTGAVTATGADGVLNVTTTRRGHRVCGGQVGWRARPYPQLGDQPAAPPAGAVLLGRHSGVGGGPFGFNFRVSKDGKRVLNVVTTIRLGCRYRAQPEETNYSPPIRIRSDGSFRGVERFTTRFADAIERTKIVIAGRFVAGGAKGTMRHTAVATPRRRGLKRDRCDTGTLRWSAAP